MLKHFNSALWYMYLLPTFDNGENKAVFRGGIAKIQNIIRWYFGEENNFVNVLLLIHFVRKLFTFSQLGKVEHFPTELIA